MSIRITNRDIDLLKWVNGLGFVNINHITYRYNISKVTAYARLRKLTNSHFLCHEHLIYDAPGHYRVTKQGVEMSGDYLPPVKKISLSSYHHDQTVAMLSLKLSEKYQAPFITERQLRHDIGIRGLGHRGHVSDGVLQLGDDNIAIEVELSTKGKRRLEKIASEHMKNFDNKEVWYFCGNNEVKNRIESVMKKAHFIKTFLIEDVMGKTDSSSE